MTRYKGRPSAKTILREFPHVVEIAVPPEGLGTRIDKMFEFHRKRGVKPQLGPHKRVKAQDYITWCFADQSNASAFCREFDGKLVDGKK
jgi:hypothetical protein